jgi:MFS family permease
MSISTSNELQVPPRAKISALEAANFSHFYWDVAWFGLAFGSTLSFLSVFATRLGAAGWQIGLLSAGPALVSVLFTLPVGRWLRGRPLDRTVTHMSIWHRIGYVLLVPLPFLLPPALQVWTILIIVLLMAIPGTALSVGFNALLATAVAPEFRGRVVGRRNALLAGTIMLAFVVSGWILDFLPFAWGYTTVFAIGAAGAWMSTYHLYKIRAPQTPQFQMRPVQDYAQPGRTLGFSGVMPHRLNIGLRLWLNKQLNLADSFASISGRYWRVMVAYFAFHFAQFLPIALFPIFWVRELKLDDGIIGWINASFYLAMLAFAALLEPLAQRLGNYRLNVVGAVLLALYPLFTALSHGPILLLIAGIIGGATWAILSGALSNRLLEHIPDNDRPAHLALYNLALNIATLSGTMMGPLMADLVGLREALFIMFVLRVASGLVLARWG